MAVIYSDNILLRSDGKALDERMSFNSISDLKNVDDDIYPNLYIGFCYEDENVYLYKKSNPVDSITGKWRIFQTGSSVDLTPYALAANVQIHTSDTDIHVTASDKANWNAKSDFDGDYASLSNKPTKLSSFNDDIGVLAHTSAINKLNGTVSESGSVLNTIASELTNITDAEWNTMLSV